MTTAEPGEAEAPIFRYELLLSPDFDAVLEGSGTPVDASGAIEAALDSGRVLLQARGGAGKSVTLDRLAQSARARGVRVVSIWAVDWSNRAAMNGPLDQATLLAALPAVSIPATRATLFADERASLLLIDGLNEVQSPYVHEILGAVDVLATRYPQLGAIIADRLARRAVDTATWQLATLTPVPDSQVREILGVAYDAEKASLYGNPFFLERARRDPTNAATHRAFFTAQVGLDDPTLRALASAVNRAYHQHQDRLVDIAELGQTIGADVVARLLEAAVLESAAERSRFAHHLISDFLAALDLAEGTSRWKREEFDALTFTASSFDALAMLLEETSPLNADLLVRRVHDWNLYAAAYLVAEDDARVHRVSNDMKVALLAMLAERRFDRLQATAQQVTDALRLQRSPIASTLLHTDSLQDIMEVIAGVKAEAGWFDEWRALFLRTNDDARRKDVALLRVGDGVLGWTAANVLKRLRMGRDALGAVIAQLDDQNATVRWRSAHVLGALPTDEVAHALLERVRSDDDLWVRYGALRSLIEVAARSGRSLRERIFIELGMVAEAITDTPQLAREVERGLHVTDAPDTWAEDAGLLLEQLWAQGRSISEQDRWREVSASLRLEEPAESRT